MSLEIQEKFQVRAEVEKVWRFLLDAAQVAACLPGAELTEVIDERTFAGTMKVKVGPVSVNYRGRLLMTHIDEAAYVVRMSGEGVDKGGNGSVKMTMECTVTALPDGGAEVAVVSGVDIVGRLVQFGRGMIKDVAGATFKQFAGHARARLEAGG